MNSLARLILILGSVVLSSCNDRIVRPDPDISLVNDHLYFHGNLYSGIVQENFDQTNTVRETRYIDGRMTGVQEEFLRDSNVRLARRHFVNGQNVGVHEGWYSNGARRFHYEYENGKSHGEFWEWYQNGQPSLYVKYENNVMLGKKMWRDDGKIYMNYVFTDGKAFGVPGTKLSYQLHDTGELLVKK